VDVEKRTIISSGLDPSGFKEGMQQVSASVTQNAAQIQRALLGSSAAFDAMKNKLIEGQKEATAFATAYLNIMRAVADGRDKLGQSAGMIENLVKQFNLVGPAANAAKQAVMGMVDASATTAQRLKASADLLQTFQERDPTGGSGSAVGNLNRSLSDLTKTTGQQQFAMRQLGVQAIQTFQGFATGQPIIMTLIQQGHQVADVMISSGTSLRELGAGFVNFIRALPAWVQITAGIAAVGAALTALLVIGEEHLRQQAALRASLSATRDDYADMAKAVDLVTLRVAAATTASSEDARKIASAFAAIRQVSETDLESLTTMAVNLQKAMGGDLQAAIKLTSDAFKDPAKAAQEAADRFKAFDAATLSLALEMAQTGDRAGATSLILQKLADIAKTAESTGVTPLQKAFENLSKEMTKTNESGKTWAQEVGESLTQVAADIINALARVVKAFQDAREAIQKDQSGLVGSPSFELDPRSHMPGGAFNVQQEELMKRFPGLFTGPGPGASVLLDESRADRPWLQGHGVGQILPSTAEGMGFPKGYIDFSAGTNLIASLAYIQKLFSELGATTPREIEAAYGGFGSSPASQARLDVKMGQLANMNTGALPTDIKGGVAYIAGIYGWPSWLTTLALQMLAGESRGRQFTSDVGGGGPLGPAQTLTVRGAAPTVPGKSFEELAKEGAAASAAFDKQRAQITELVNLQNQLEAAREAAVRAGDAPGEARIAQQMEQNAIAIKNAVDPTRQQTQALMDQAKAAGVLGEADRKLLETQLEIDRQRSENPLHPMSEEAAAAKMAAVRAQLNSQAKVGLESAQRETASLEEQEAALGKLMDTYGSYAAVQSHLLNLEKARVQVRATAAHGSAEEKQQVEALTAELDKQVKLRNTLALQPVVIQQRQQLGLLGQQAANIGLSPQDQARSNAELQATNQLMNENKDVTSKLGQEYIKLQGDIAAAAVANSELKASYDELANATSQAFDTIGNSIAQAFLSGKDAAVTFQSVMKTVVQQIIQEVIKLAIINPLLNSLFPGSGTRPTIGSVLGAVGGGGGNIFNNLSNAGTNFIGELTGQAVVNIGPATAAQAASFLAQGGIVPGLPSMMNLPGIGAFSNQIISNPTLFRAYAQGGMMGEAGPEAVIPLVRGPSGDLGIRGGGDTAVVVHAPITINGNAAGPNGKLDPAALAAMQKQIEGAIHDAARRTIVDEKRPGGDLFGR
jgi:phage-related minor tail protein